MASTLEGGGKRDRTITKGHGTGALGPSDTSDSGSDIVGAGADVGDINLDSDTDSVGTGEHRTAGREPRIRRDIGTDRVESVADQVGVTDAPKGGKGA